MVRSRRFIRARHSSGSAGVRRARWAVWIVLVGSIAGFTVLMTERTVLGTGDDEGGGE